MARNSGLPQAPLSLWNSCQVGSEVSPFIGKQDAAQETFSGSLLHRFCAELLLTLPATHHEPTSCLDGGGPTWRHTTGNWRRIDFVALPLHWLSACSNAHTWQHGELALQDREDHRAASVDVSPQLPCTGQRVNRNFASRRALKLPDVAQRSEASGGLCLAGLSTGTLTGWKLLLPSWLAHFRTVLRLKRGAQKRTGSRQILGRLLSSTEIVDITSLRGSGSANPFSCGLPIGLGALSPLTRLGKQGRTLLAIVWSLHCKRAFCSLLQSRQQRQLKQTVVLRLRRQATSIQADLDNGVSTSLWSFVRYLSKKKARRGPKTAVVLRTPQGDIASSAEDLARVWQEDTFFQNVIDYVPLCLSDA